MAGKARVHELAKELGVTSKEVLARLKEQGEFVKSASSTVEAPVARRLRESFDPVEATPRRRRRQVPGRVAPRARKPAAGPGRPASGSRARAGLDGSAQTPASRPLQARRPDAPTPARTARPRRSPRRRPRQRPRHRRRPLPQHRLRPRGASGGTGTRPRRPRRHPRRLPASPVRGLRASATTRSPRSGRRSWARAASRSRAPAVRTRGRAGGASRVPVQGGPRPAGPVVRPGARGPASAAVGRPAPGQGGPRPSPGSCLRARTPVRCPLVRLVPRPRWPAAPGGPGGARGGPAVPVVPAAVAVATAAVPVVAAAPALTGAPGGPPGGFRGRPGGGGGRGRGGAAGAFGRPGGAPARGRKSKRAKRAEYESMQAPAVGGVRLPRGNGETIRLARGASLSDFAEKIDANPAALVQALFNLGEMVTATQSVNDETLELLGERDELRRPGRQPRGRGPRAARQRSTSPTARTRAARTISSSVRRW